jgi:hypothetical protein
MSNARRCMLALLVTVTWATRAGAQDDAARRVKVEQTAKRIVTTTATRRSSEQASVLLSGRVVDDQTGKPVEHFSFEWGWPEGPEGKVGWGGMVTRSSRWVGGKFTQQSGLGEGKKIWARIVAPGYSPQPVMAEPVVGPLELKNLVVRLTKGGAITGTIVDHRGKAVNGARVYLVSTGLELQDGAAQGFTGSTATSDPEGRFTINGYDDSGTQRLAIWSQAQMIGTNGKKEMICAPAIPAWVVAAEDLAKPIASTIPGTGKTTAVIPESGLRTRTIQLPQPGNLRLSYDVPHSDPRADIRLELATWDINEWRGVQVVLTPKADNGGSIEFQNLTPGEYDLARVKTLRLDQMGRSVFLDRQRVKVEAGKTADVAMVRREGVEVSGRVVGIDEAGVSGATIYIKDDKATGDAEQRDEWKLKVFDAMTCDEAGRFSTARLEPGAYAFIAEAYLPETAEMRGRSGIRLPDFVAVKKVTVAKDGQAPEVELALLPRQKRRSPRGN